MGFGHTSLSMGEVTLILCFSQVVLNRLSVSICWDECVKGKGDPGEKKTANKGMPERLGSTREFPVSVIQFS